jgi:hypothetical protein
MGKIFTRAGRAAIFDRRAYTESFFDNDAAADGAILVAVVAAATYVGSLARIGGLGLVSLRGLLSAVIAGVVSWLILAFATWFVATRLFGGVGRPQTMIAMHGLAPLPLLLEIGGGQVFGAVALLWYLAVLVVGTREASELDLRKAGVAVLVGFALAVLVRALINAPFALFSALG